MKPPHKFAIICFAAIILLSTFFRFYHISQPNDVIFDEVYFPVFAQDYISSTDFFDAHPPLGKLIIAGGIKLFGNNPIGWRVANATTGVLLIVMIAGFVYDATKKTTPALLAALLVATDPMALVESRVGLINIYLAFFSILGLWLFWRWWRNPKANLSFILCLVAFAAAGAVKWIGLGAFGAAIIFFFTRRWNKDQLQNFRWWHLVLAIVLPLLLYCLTFARDIGMRYHTINHSAIEYFRWWHVSAFEYHATLKATHPYGSDWWTWPFSVRPLWLYFKSLPDHRIIGIIEPGNLITWIGGLVAFIGAIWHLLQKKWGENRDSFLSFLVVSYIILYIPWSIITRVKFIYHYFIPVLILHIITALVLDELIKTKSGKITTGVFLTAGTIFFIFFLPLLMGLGVSDTVYHWHILFKSWI